MSQPGSRLAGGGALIAAVLIAAGLAVLPELPPGSAGAQDVYEFFLDQESSIPVAALLITIAMLFVAAAFSGIRLLLATHGSRALPGAMYGLALIAAGAQAFAAATLTTVTLRAEQSDPATARALLDLTELGIGVSGAALGLALVTLAVAAGRTPGALPARLRWPTLAAAVCLLLWAVRLGTDTGAFAADSLLGSTLGWLALLAWLVGTGIGLLGRPADAGTPVEARAGAATGQ